MLYLSKTPYIINETNDVYFIYKPDGYISDNSFGSTFSGTQTAISRVING